MFTEALESPAIDGSGLLCEMINRMKPVDRSAMRIAPPRNLIFFVSDSHTQQLPTRFRSVLSLQSHRYTGLMTPLACLLI